MKKIIFLLLLVSCEKIDDTFCYDCIKIYKTEYLKTHTLVIEVDTINKCDFSEKDAERFEDIHTIPKTSISTCGDVIRWVDTICEKQ